MRLKILRRAYTPWAKRARGWDIFFLETHTYNIHLGKYFDSGWFFCARFESKKHIYYLNIEKYGTRHGRINKKDFKLN